MRISQNLILLPVVMQVFLTMFVLLLVARARKASMNERGQTAQDMALATDADWSVAARKAHNNFRNQLELPMLFYAVCGFALTTRMVDGWMLGLAVVFSASRIVHAVIHIGPNIVAWRGSVYSIGLLALAAMWVLLTWRIVAAGY